MDCSDVTSGNGPAVTSRSSVLDPRKKETLDVTSKKHRLASNVPIVAMTWRDNVRGSGVGSEGLGSWVGRGAREYVTSGNGPAVTSLSSVLDPRKNETLDVVTSKIIPEPKG